MKPCRRWPRWDRRREACGLAPASFQLTFLAGALLGPSAAPAGHVVTRTDRLEGEISLRQGRFEILLPSRELRAVKVEEALYILSGVRLQRARGPHVTRLRSGEILPGRIGGYDRRELRCSSALLGEVAVEPGLLAEIVFAPGLSPESQARSGWLYRASGEPAPGTLLWMDAERLGFESPLGVLTLKREALARYVFSTTPLDPSRDPSAYEVLLSDGTLLHGDLSPAAQGIELDHLRFGKRDLPAKAIVSIVQREPGVLDLTRQAPLSSETVPLLEGPPRSDGTRILSSRADAGPDDPAFAKALRIEVGTVVRYALPAERGAPRKFRALLGTPGDGRGDLHFSLAAGSTVILDRELLAGSRGEWLEVDLPPCEELSLRVDFGERLRFPAAVILGDPHVVIPAASPGGEGP